MADELKGQHIAILATDGVEQSELEQPWQAARQAGAQVDLVSVKTGSIQAMQHDDKTRTYAVDRTVGEAAANEYDALILPGGVANPDRLRTHPSAVEFAGAFFRAAKPVAAICHGPWRSSRRTSSVAGR